jgi:hypothetical protein
MPSTITSANKEVHKFVSADMFSNFVSRYQSQMDMVQNSLKMLNDSFYHEEVSKEKEEVNGKRKSSDQVSNLDFSAKRLRRDDHKVSDVESMCVGDLDGNADCAGAKAGGSEAHVNKSSEEMSNVNNVSGAECFDASKLLGEKILEFNTEEKMGLNLNENFAKFINSLLANQMAPTKCNDLYDKYLRPGNCNLNYPTVNDVIWDNCINSFGCSLDVKLHTIQRCLLKGLTLVVNLVNRLLENKDLEVDKGVLTQELFDSTALLTSTS